MKSGTRPRTIPGARGLGNSRLSLLVVLIVATLSYSTWMALRRSSQQAQISRRILQTQTKLEYVDGLSPVLSMGDTARPFSKSAIRRITPSAHARQEEKWISKAALSSGGISGSA